MKPFKKVAAVFASSLILAACSDSGEISDSPLFSDSASHEISKLKAEYSRSNPVGQVSGTVVDEAAMYKKVAANVGRVDAIPLPKGVYAGRSLRDVGGVAWRDGKPVQITRVLELSSDGRFAMVDRIDEIHTDATQFRGITGDYSIKGFTIQLTSVEGHVDMVPPGGAVVVNQLAMAGESSPYPLDYVDWGLVKQSGGVHIDLIYNDLSLIGMKGVRHTEALGYLRDGPIGQGMTLTAFARSVIDRAPEPFTM